MKGPPHPHPQGETHAHSSSLGTLEEISSSKSIESLQIDKAEIQRHIGTRVYMCTCTERQRGFLQLCVQCIE